MPPASPLISDFLIGELDSAGLTELTTLLDSDSSVVDQLVFDSFVHWQLHDWMYVRHFRDELLTEAFRDLELDHCALRADLRAEANELPHKGVRSRVGTIVGFAATFLLAASILTAGYFAWRPAIVAQLTEADNCCWEAESANLSAGSLLHAGQLLRLKSGRAMLTFASGTQLILEGPAEVQLRTEMSAELTAGRAGALVPTQAIGFTVATPVARFVDLGTEFTLTLEPDDSCELQVFDGLVELQLEPHAKRAAEHLRISEGSAVRFDADIFSVRSIPYDKEQRITD